MTAILRGVRLPPSSGGGAVRPNPIQEAPKRGVLAVNDDGKYFFNGKILDTQQEIANDFFEKDEENDYRGATTFSENEAPEGFKIVADEKFIEDVIFNREENTKRARQRSEIGRQFEDVLKYNDDDLTAQFLAEKFDEFDKSTPYITPDQITEWDKSYKLDGQKQTPKISGLSVASNIIRSRPGDIIVPLMATTAGAIASTTTAATGVLAPVAPAIGIATTAATSTALTKVINKGDFAENVFNELAPVLKVYDAAKKTGDVETAAEAAEAIKYLIKEMGGTQGITKATEEKRNADALISGVSDALPFSEVGVAGKAIKGLISKPAAKTASKELIEASIKQQPGLFKRVAKTGGLAAVEGAATASLLAANNEAFKERLGFDTNYKEAMSGAAEVGALLSGTIGSGVGIFKSKQRFRTDQERLINAVRDVNEASAVSEKSPIPEGGAFGYYVNKIYNENPDLDFQQAKNIAEENVKNSYDTLTPEQRNQFFDAIETEYQNYYKNALNKKIQTQTTQNLKVDLGKEDVDFNLRNQTTSKDFFEYDDVTKIIDEINASGLEPSEKQYLLDKAISQRANTMSSDDVSILKQSGFLSEEIRPQDYSKNYDIYSKNIGRKIWGDVSKTQKPKIVDVKKTNTQKPDIKKEGKNPINLNESKVDIGGKAIDFSTVDNYLKTGKPFEETSIRRKNVKSLSDSIKEWGGIRDTDNDFSGRDYGKGVLKKDGPALDDDYGTGASIRERMISAGYIDETATKSDIINLINEDLSGRKVYPKENTSDMFRKQEYSEAENLVQNKIVSFGEERTKAVLEKIKEMKSKLDSGDTAGLFSINKQIPGVSQRYFNLGEKIGVEVPTSKIPSDYDFANADSAFKAKHGETADVDVVFEKFLNDEIGITTDDFLYKFDELAQKIDLNKKYLEHAIKKKRAEAESKLVKGPIEAEIKQLEKEWSAAEGSMFKTSPETGKVELSDFQKKYIITNDMDTVRASEALGLLDKSKKWIETLDQKIKIMKDMYPELKQFEYESRMIESDIPLDLGSRRAKAAMDADVARLKLEDVEKVLSPSLKKYFKEMDVQVGEVPKGTEAIIKSVIRKTKANQVIQDMIIISKNLDPSNSERLIRVFTHELTHSILERLSLDEKKMFLSEMKKGGAPYEETLKDLKARGFSKDVAEFILSNPSEAAAHYAEGVINGRIANQQRSVIGKIIEMFKQTLSKVSTAFGGQYKNLNHLISDIAKGRLVKEQFLKPVKTISASVKETSELGRYYGYNELVAGKSLEGLDELMPSKEAQRGFLDDIYSSTIKDPDGVNAVLDDIESMNFRDKYYGKDNLKFDRFKKGSTTIVGDILKWTARRTTLWLNHIARNNPAARNVVNLATSIDGLAKGISHSMNMDLNVVSQLKKEDLYKLSNDQGFAIDKRKYQTNVVFDATQAYERLKSKIDKVDSELKDIDIYGEKDVKSKKKLLSELINAMKDPENPYDALSRFIARDIKNSVWSKYKNNIRDSINSGREQFLNIYNINLKNPESIVFPKVNYGMIENLYKNSGSTIDYANSLKDYMNGQFASVLMPGSKGGLSGFERGALKTNYITQLGLRSPVRAVLTNTVLPKPQQIAIASKYIGPSGAGLVLMNDARTLSLIKSISSAAFGNPDKMADSFFNLSKKTISKDQKALYKALGDAVLRGEIGGDHMTYGGTMDKTIKGKLDTVYENKVPESSKKAIKVLGKGGDIVMASTMISNTITQVSNFLTGYDIAKKLGLKTDAERAMFATRYQYDVSGQYSDWAKPALFKSFGGRLLTTFQTEAYNLTSIALSLANKRSIATLASLALMSFGMIGFGGQFQDTLNLLELGKLGLYKITNNPDLIKPTQVMALELMQELFGEELGKQIYNGYFSTMFGLSGSTTGQTIIPDFVKIANQGEFGTILDELSNVFPGLSGVLGLLNDAFADTPNKRETRVTLFKQINAIRKGDVEKAVVGLPSKEKQIERTMNYNLGLNAAGQQSRLNNHYLSKVDDLINQGFDDDEALNVVLKEIREQQAKELQDARSLNLTPPKMKKVQEKIKSYKKAIDFLYSSKKKGKYIFKTNDELEGE